MVTFGGWHSVDQILAHILVVRILADVSVVHFGRLEFFWFFFLWVELFFRIPGRVRRQRDVDVTEMVGSREGTERHGRAIEIHGESEKREGNMSVPDFASCLQIVAPVLHQILSNGGRELSKLGSKYIPTLPVDTVMLGWDDLLV